MIRLQRHICGGARIKPPDSEFCDDEAVQIGKRKDAIKNLENKQLINKTKTLFSKFNYYIFWKFWYVPTNFSQKLCKHFKRNILYTLTDGKMWDKNDKNISG